jgi:hypothetical protein
VYKHTLVVRVQTVRCVFDDVAHHPMKVTMETSRHIDFSMMIVYRRNVLYSAGAGAAGGTVHAVLSNGVDAIRETLARPREERNASGAIALYRSQLPKGMEKSVLVPMAHCACKPRLPFGRSFR